MPEFTPWDAYDWNAFAALLPNLPDDVIANMLRAAPQGDTLFAAWENAWKMTGAAFGLPGSEKLLANNKSFRDIMLAFYRAEAVRRGLDLG